MEMTICAIVIFFQFSFFNLNAAHSYFEANGSDGHSHDHSTPSQVSVPSIKEVRIEVDFEGLEPGGSSPSPSYSCGPCDGRACVSQRRVHV